MLDRAKRPSERVALAGKEKKEKKKNGQEYEEKEEEKKREEGGRGGWGRRDRNISLRCQRLGQERRISSMKRIHGPAL